MPPLITPPSSRPARGFSVAELVIVLAVIGILVALAYPSWRGHWLKARRGDAHNALMQLQQAQERWRADHRSYATADELQAPATSPQGHYRLSVTDASPSGYELRAEATGAQQGDGACRVLGLRLAEGALHRLAGADTLAPEPTLPARRCWSR